MPSLAEISTVSKTNVKICKPSTLGFNVRGPQNELIDIRIKSLPKLIAWFGSVEPPERTDGIYDSAQLINNTGLFTNGLNIHAKTGIVPGEHVITIEVIDSNAKVLATKKISITATGSCAGGGNKFTLVVDSLPMKGVPFTLDGSSKTTTYKGKLKAGVKNIIVNNNVAIGGNLYVFQKWEDGSVNPARIVNLNADTTIVAYFQLQPPPPAPAPPPPAPAPAPVPPPGKVILAVNEAPEKAGWVNLHGKSEPAKDSVVTIHQRPNPGYTFDHWTVNGVNLWPGDILENRFGPGMPAPPAVPNKITGVRDGLAARQPGVPPHTIPDVDLYTGDSEIDIKMDQNYSVVAHYTGGPAAAAPAPAGGPPAGPGGPPAGPPGAPPPAGPGGPPGAPPPAGPGGPPAGPPGAPPPAGPGGPPAGPPGGPPGGPPPAGPAGPGCKIVVYIDNKASDLEAENVSVHCDPQPTNSTFKLADVPAKKKVRFFTFLTNVANVYDVRCLCNTHDPDPEEYNVDVDCKNHVYKITFTLKEKKKERGELHWRDAYSHWSIRDYMPTIALVAIGLIVSSMTGNFWFIVGFFSWAAYYMFPNPADYWPMGDQPEDDRAIRDADLTGLDIRHGGFGRVGHWGRGIGRSFRGYGGNLHRAVSDMHHDRPGRHHYSMAFTKSFFKSAAIIGMYAGFMGGGFMGLFVKSEIPFFNLFGIITLFVGYLSYSHGYDLGDRYNPSQFIDSTYRFILGCTFIPFAFLSIFDSWVLALIAWAFFIAPPHANRGAGGAPTADVDERLSLYEIPMKFVFALLMGIALIGSGALGGWAIAIVFVGIGLLFAISKIPMGAPIFIVLALLMVFSGDIGMGGLFQMIGGVGWELTGLLKGFFLYFWFVTFVAGFFAPTENRAEVGMLMLGAATVIYAFGPGTQEVGGAILGDWFPTVYTGFSDVFKPLAELFTGFGGMFGTGWKLLTNPVGYAQQMMNGSYATDSDTGLAGAYGIEITSFRTSLIYVCRPYTVSLKLDNKGAFDAEEVSIRISSPLHYDPSWAPGDETYINIGQLGFVDDTELEIACHNTNIGDDDFRRGTPGYCEQPLQTPDRNLNKLASTEVFFPATDMIDCATTLSTNLREKFIPLTAVVMYKYKIDSSFEIEFMGRDEWDRRTREGIVSVAKKAATLTNAPVRLNIDTQEQPITEGMPFSVDINLAGAQGNKGNITDMKFIELEFPGEFLENVPGFSHENDCYPAPRKDGNKLVWDKAAFSQLKGVYVASCYFKQGLTDLEVPSKTFVLRGNANYTYQRIDTKSTKLEFGGIKCCSEKSFWTRLASSFKGKDVDCPRGETPECDFNTFSCGGLACPVSWSTMSDGGGDQEPDGSPQEPDTVPQEPDTVPQEPDTIPQSS
ncbi:MAG: MFS transporter [Candidatus Aenigmarchaeota archaeon]|nr:MFS transporter [Candidatus Aenigmarchaeota archaeon]